MSEPTWDAAAEQAWALRAGEQLRPIFEQIKAQLPPGIDFGIVLCVPPLRGETEGRTLALCTDRRAVGLAAAQWIVNARPFDG